MAKIPENWKHRISKETDKKIFSKFKYSAILAKILAGRGITTEKEIFMNLAKSDRAMSILLHGPPGTGKTTAIRLFAHEYLGEHFDTKFEKYNASSEVNVKKIRGDIIDFAGSEDDTGLRNIIFFDEVDEYLDSFWGSYNYIKPDESLQDAVKRLFRDKKEIL